jgi:hypothetical protein
MLARNLPTLCRTLPACLAILLYYSVLAVPLSAERVFGLDHLPLGYAILEPQADQLCVHTSGLSNDGVRTLTAGLPVTWGLVFAPLHPALTETHLQITHTGIIETDVVQTLSMCSIRRLGPETQIDLDFSHVNARSLVIDYVFDNHSILREAYADTAQLNLMSFGHPDSLITELLRLLGLYRFTFGWPGRPQGVIVHTPQGNVLPVHEVRIVAEEIPISLDGFMHVDLQLMGIPDLTIIREWTELSACPWCITGDLNRDGRVGLADLAIVAANWLQCTDATDPTCTWTAQLSEPGLDRTVSVLMCETAPLYRLGMSRREFFDDLYPGLDCYGAPDWVHKLADLLWDMFAPPGM